MKEYRLPDGRRARVVPHYSVADYLMRYGVSSRQLRDPESTKTGKYNARLNGHRHKSVKENDE